ncbi:homoserine dehydrogenase [Herbiconiux moechotypicola]|uniref:homoserine dehydrogenase n=1 Tax=Herbiconiux moechotypicola TaxID=637393 RepID=UPI00217D9A6E|nr:homoserine dehydrogenase [Herbiconiux moechotypicola]MCS5728218.1 homoserine dehydrogenase [Herbiconiux moechotypicola]
MTSLEHPMPAAADVRVALTGARGGFGRTFLAQVRAVPRLVASQLIDPDTVGVRTMLDELGFGPEGSEGVPTLVASAADIDWDSIDVLVEATGRIDAGYDYAATALAHGVHVVMVSKEVESLAGVSLAADARAAGVFYLPGDGDQPANLVRLLAWVERTGLEVVALGKSGEYDLVFDPEAETVTQLDQTILAPGLGDLLTLGDDVPATLAARAAAVAGLKRAAAADSCEMAVVSLHTGALSDVERMHYPVARPDELADIYAAVAEGGIRERDRVVDVFSALRLPGEASFAGGVFAVVRTNDSETWEMLRGKGHVVSRSGDYATIYWPYHFMGVETVLTVLDAFDGVAPTAPVAARIPQQHTVLAARAARDLPAGTRFRVEGHHHEIAGVAPVIVDRAVAAAPDAPGEVAISAYYLLSGAVLTRDVVEGELIALADLDEVPAQALAAFRAGFAL